MIKALLQGSLDKFLSRVAQGVGKLTPSSVSHQLRGIDARVQTRTGKIPFSARYHRAPKKLEDDYKLSNQVLGSGCNGSVMMATGILQPDQKFAVKSFPFRSFLVQYDLDLFLAEVENYLAMDHPHIARLVDVYESNDHLHLVMECMEGGEVFDRLKEKKTKRFSEEEARDALYQMLLAVNYLHSHGFVHRDIKLENFVYEKNGSDHLKLIDFGLGCTWDCSQGNMRAPMGTMSYMAPEMINRSYTNKCDMWSLGVVGFMLLSGEAPFCRTGIEQLEQMRRGCYYMKPNKWNGVSAEAKDFIRSLMEIDPSKRLSAQEALEHSWMKTHRVAEHSGMKDVVTALQQFGHHSQFHQSCMKMLALSLSNEDGSKVRDYFASLDKNHQGSITLGELKDAIEKFGIDDRSEVLLAFEALHCNNDKEIHYSDFVAAMLGRFININDNLLASAFHRFDVDSAGSVTAKNLRSVLGSHFDGQDVEAIINEIDQNNAGSISLAQFSAHFRTAHSSEVKRLNGKYEPSFPAAAPAEEKTPNRSSETCFAFLTMRLGHGNDHRAASLLMAWLNYIV